MNKAFRRHDIQERSKEAQVLGKKVDFETTQRNKAVAKKKKNKQAAPALTGIMREARTHPGYGRTVFIQSSG